MSESKTPMGRCLTDGQFLKLAALTLILVSQFAILIKQVESGGNFELLNDQHNSSKLTKLTRNLRTRRTSRSEQHLQPRGAAATSTTQFDDELEEDQERQDSSELGLAGVTYTLQSSSGDSNSNSTPRFYWSDERSRRPEWQPGGSKGHHTGGRLTTAMGKLHLDQMEMNAKYSTQVRKTLHSIRPLRMTFSTAPTTGDDTEVTSTVSNLLGRNETTGPNTNVLNSAPSPTTVTTVATTMPTTDDNQDGNELRQVVEKRRQNKKFLSDLSEPLRPIILASDVKVRSDLVLVSDHSNRSDVYGHPVKTLSQRVKLPPHRVVVPRRPAPPVPASSLFIVSGDSLQILDKNDVDQQEDNSAPGGEAQQHDLLIFKRPHHSSTQVQQSTLGELLRQQADEQTRTSSSVVDGDLLDINELATKRTSDDDQPGDQHDELQAGSSNSVAISGNSRAKRPISANNPNLSRKFSTINSGAPNDLQEIRSSSSGIRVIVGNGTLPLFMNSRGLITAKKTSPKAATTTSTTTTSRPYDPNQLFASSQSSQTLNPIEFPSPSSPQQLGSMKVPHKVSHKNKHKNGTVLNKDKLSSLARPHHLQQQLVSGATLETAQLPFNNSSLFSAQESGPFVDDAESTPVEEEHRQQLQPHWSSGHINRFGPPPTINGKRNSSKTNSHASHGGSNSNSNKVAFLDLASAFAHQPNKQTPSSSSVSSLASSLASSLLDPVDEQQPPPSPEVTTVIRFNGTRPGSMTSTSTTTAMMTSGNDDESTTMTTLAANFNHNPPYKHHLPPESVTQPSFVSFPQTTTMMANSSSSSSHGHQANSTRPNNRFHATAQANLTLSFNSTGHAPPIKIKLNSANSTAGLEGHNHRNKRPSSTILVHAHKSPQPHAAPYEPALSNVLLSEPANTLQIQHLNASLVSAHHLQQASNATSGPKPNKIRIKLHNLLLKKLLTKPNQQQALLVATSSGANHQQQQFASSPAPLLSSTVANNVANMLAQRITSLVRPQQQQQQQQSNPFNSLFGFRVGQGSNSLLSNSAVNKLKQRVNPFAGVQTQSANLNRRTSGVGSLLVSGLIYGLTVLPALMALTGINPLSPGDSPSGPTSEASSISSESLAVNRHATSFSNQAQQRKTRSKSKRNNGSQLDNLIGDSATSAATPSSSLVDGPFAYLIPLISSASLASDGVSSAQSQQLDGPLPVTDTRPSALSSYIANEPQSATALNSLYAPPPTVLESFAGVDLNSILDEANLNWPNSQYSTNARHSSHQQRRHRNRHRHNHRHSPFAPHRPNESRFHQTSADEANFVPMNSNGNGKDSRDWPPQARRHRDLYGNNSSNQWRSADHNNIPYRQSDVEVVGRPEDSYNDITTRAPAVASFDDRVATGGAQQSVGSVSFEQPTTTRGPIQMHWSDRQQQQLGPQALRKSGAAASVATLIQVVSPPPSLMMNSNDNILSGRDRMPTQQINGSGWNVGAVQSDHSQGSPVKIQQQQDTSQMYTTTTTNNRQNEQQHLFGQHLVDPLINTVRQTQPQLQRQLSGELALLGPYKPMMLDDNAQLSQIDLDGGLRHRRTINGQGNHIGQSQLSAVSGGDVLSMSNNYQQNHHENRTQQQQQPDLGMPNLQHNSMVSLGGNSGADHHLSNHNQHQFFSHSQNQGQRSAPLPITTAVDRERSQAQSILSQTSLSLQSGNKLNHGDNSNGLGTFQPFPDHLNSSPNNGGWSSEGEWRAVAPLPGVSVYNRLPIGQRRPADQNAPLELITIDGPPQTLLHQQPQRYNSAQQANFTKSGNIETVVGKELWSLPSSQTRDETSPSAKKRQLLTTTSKSKKANSKKRHSLSGHNSNKSKNKSSTTTSTTTRAPYLFERDDDGESELLIAHSMAMGSRVINEPITGHQH